MFVSFGTSGATPVNEENTYFRNSYRFLKDVRPKLAIPTLTAEERVSLAKHALVIMEQFYVHKDQKIKMHGPQINPIPKLAAISDKAANMSSTDLLYDISKVFLSQRDMHLKLTFPYPLACLRAILPFRLKLVSIVNSHSSSNISNFKIAVQSINKEIELSGSREQKLAFKKVLKTIEIGDMILSWNDQSPWKVINQVKTLAGGANKDSAISRGVHALTFRDLGQLAPPVENGVWVKLQHKNGKIYTIFIPWISERLGWCEREYSLKRREQLENSVYNSVDNPAEHWMASCHWRNVGGQIEGGIDDSVQVKIFTNSHGTFGLLRIKEFYPLGSLKAPQSPRPSTDKIFQDLKDRLSILNNITDGLVIDVRDNSGGIWGDRLVQLFSRVKVESQTEYIRASKLNLQFLQAYSKFKFKEEHYLDYLPVLKEALTNGQRYTKKISINSENLLNATGQVYKRPVTIVANPNCYSYCDYFVTSMQDHGIATVWGENGWKTGGGGADDLDYNLVLEALPHLRNGFPSKVHIRFAWAAGLRTGKNKDIPIEDEGATADKIYYSTMEDLLNQDKNLLEVVTKNLYYSN